MSAKKSQIITLRLDSDRLAQFPSDVSSSTKRQSSGSVKRDVPPSTQHPNDADKTSDDASGTPAPANDGENADNKSLAPPPADNKKKKGGAAGTGRKRAPPSIDPNAPPRERGRPGPKKKPRLPDGTIDRTGENGVPGANPIPAHKLGPKANTGAINAGLRALDRTGKPCRRWHKKGLELKSFTGTMWSMPTWGAPPRDNGFSGDVKSDSTGSSELKPVHESSAVQSQRSQSHADGGDTTMVNGIESSPAPPIAV